MQIERHKAEALAKQAESKEADQLVKVKAGGVKFAAVGGKKVRLTGVWKPSMAGARQGVFCVGYAAGPGGLAPSSKDGVYGCGPCYELPF